MTRRTILFTVFALTMAALCVRLGFWQVDRLHSRRAQNATVAARLGAPPAPLADVVRDPASAQYRRATASGTYDYANELALSSRTRAGSPGVNIVTPLRLEGSDTAVLVNRGWVYSPDGMTVDFNRWRERDTATVTGYVVAIGRTEGGRVTTSTSARAVRRLDRDSLAARIPYSLAPVVLVALSDGASPGDSTPVRLAAPALDEGPHRGYALQWFAFAVIAIVGLVFALRAQRRSGGQRPVVRRVPTR